MAELVHERVLRLVDPSGRVFDRVYVFAEPGRVTWSAWIEFVSSDESTVLRTDHETSQSNLEAVAYWATGLEETYFEGAMDRAWRRTEGRGTPQIAASPATGGGVVRMQAVSVDPDVPLHLMATRTLSPGLRRRVHNGGVLVYQGASETTDGAWVYDVIAQYGSDNAAAVLANTLWSDLHGLGVRLYVEGVEVPLNHAAIKEALLSSQPA
jgi:hypothetical protein